MKIIFNLFKILVVILVLFLLTQNANQFVDIHLFTYTYSHVNLYVVIIISLAIGALLGAAFMALSVLQARSKVRELRKKNKQLIQELENLRNLAVDEIPDEGISPSETEK